jgi:hypothetical protein
VSYYRFKDTDIIDIDVFAHPSYDVELNGNKITGSIYLDKPFLNSGLETRIWKGFSDKEGGLVQKQGPFSASIDILNVVQGGTNKELYNSIIQLYNYYSLIDYNYTPTFTGSQTTKFRVITIPEIYYDRQILTGSFTASDHDNDSGDLRTIYDNGRGGIYSGSLTGTLIGNIFYSEGLVVLKAGGLNETTSGEYGATDVSNGFWKMSFKGVNKIPVKIFRCRAPAGQLNASTNPTFYYTAGIDSEYHGDRVRMLSESVAYVSVIGLYNDRYELVASAHLAQPIRKKESEDILFKIRMDW